MMQRIRGKGQTLAGFVREAWHVLEPTTGIDRPCSIAPVGTDPKRHSMQNPPRSPERVCCLRRNSTHVRDSKVASIC
jgi:hypothetical protein